MLVPWRWALGDRPFVDEQNLTQSAGLLAYPFVKLFALVRGGDVAGLVLYERHLYLALAVIVAACVFLLARRTLSGVAGGAGRRPIRDRGAVRDAAADRQHARRAPARRRRRAGRGRGPRRRTALRAGRGGRVRSGLRRLPDGAADDALRGRLPGVQRGRADRRDGGAGLVPPSASRRARAHGRTRVARAQRVGAGRLPRRAAGSGRWCWRWRARPTSSAAGTTPSPSPTSSTSWGAPPRRSRWPARSSVSSWTSGTSSPPRSSRCWCSAPARGRAVAAAAHAAGPLADRDDESAARVRAP